MNTNQLKKFAQSARTKLMEQVGARLEFVLHTDSAELREKTDSLRQLQEAINATSKAQVIDKVAYTWFNRLMALRFMDANDYQPMGIRIVTPKDGYTLPEILEEAKHGHIADELSVNHTLIAELLDGHRPSNNPQNEAYKHLLIAACNYLNKVFPFLFERINDYTELLIPDDLISQYSIVQDVRDGMSTEDCAEVEIIGWLYQFYISEKKDEVFASKSAVKKEDIPAATQLFTPRWIVEYMVQNTVGKLWLQNRPNSRIKQYMPYYIESASSTATDYLKLNSIEELRLLDQACGSGHILVYGFDLLYKIYEEEGYNPSDIPQLIIEKNLYGFEIDERASQLAGMALMMKARSYHRRFFRKEVEPHILCYSDLSLDESVLKDTFAELKINLPESLKYDLKLMCQATNLGSLIQPKTSIEALNTTHVQLNDKLKTSDIFSQPAIEALQTAIKQLIPLAQKYHCIVENPPYMGDSKYNKQLSEYVYVNYPASKLDLMACFIEVGLKSLENNGFLAIINQHSWMFISSYKDLRKYIYNNVIVDNMLHLGTRTFPEIGGEVVQNTTFTLKKTKDIENITKYFRLVEFDSTEKKRLATIDAITGVNKALIFHVNQSDFNLIPNNNICYWFSKKTIDNFNQKKVDTYAKSKAGIVSGNDADFLRLWYEVSNLFINLNESEFNLSSSVIWVPINKGGSIRRYFGNEEYIINIKNLWLEGRTNKSVRRGDPSYYFNEAITWTMVCGTSFSFRYSKNNTFATAAPALFFDSNRLTYYTLGFLNSKISISILPGINPTINLGSGDVSRLPLIESSNENKINLVVISNIDISKNEWNSKETSWHFKTSPLFDVLLGDIGMAGGQFAKSRIASKIKDGITLQDAYNEYMAIWRNMFFQLHSNEEELNRQFIEIYGLQDELTPDVPLEDITILKEETSIENGELVFHADEVMAQFVSYAVGCMFGRYSLDMPGLILANQGETLEDYFQKVGLQKSPSGDLGVFLPDDDNIIPVLDDEWFEDDIVGRFHEFLKASFGKENFEKNLNFVEESLGMDMRKYFTKNFYADHIKRYKKRPIYWMFSSPKGSFNVLIYMHRYTPDTLNQILNKYLREYKEKISAHIEHLDHIIESGSSSEATKANKQKDKYKLVLLELQEYERDILYPLATERIALDLDDGVLVNYNKFGRTIKEVAGLNDSKTKKKVKEFEWINGEVIR